MFNSLGRGVARHPWITVAAWLVLTIVGFSFAVLGLRGDGLFDRVTTGAPLVPGSDSKRAADILSDERILGPRITLLVEGVDARDPDLVAAMADINRDLEAIPDAQPPVDPYVIPEGLDDPRAAAMIAADGRGFVAYVDVDAGLGDQEGATAHTVAERLRDVPSELRAEVPSAARAEGIVSSNALIVSEITDQVRADLETGEVFSLPVALLVMVIVFGGFLAAGMPMFGAFASIGAGLGALLGITYVMDVDASVVNVVTVLGLGLSIDYGLLVVSRYREELHRLVAAGADPPAAVRTGGDGVVDAALVRTMSTAGRTITFSALTVAIAISGLLVFRPPILRSIGAGALAVVLIAFLTALTLVPAVLHLTGRRLARPSRLAGVPGIRRMLARTADVQSDDGALARLAAWVQRRPWPVLIGTSAILLVLAAPVLSLQMRNTGLDLLPRDSDQRAFVTALGEQYPAMRWPQIEIVAKADPATAQAWSAALNGLDHVEQVDAPQQTGEYVAIGVHTDSPDAGGPEAVALVHEIRGLQPDFQMWVGGQAAGQIDFLDALAQRVWWAVAIVVVAVLALLFLMTGSVVIPIKTLLTNALSLCASLGVLVWAFQFGHLQGVLGFTPVGGIETYVVALFVAFSFGLAMDYEVFLLARVKELHDSGLSNDDAIRIGLQRSGRIITSAAAIIIVVFAGFMLGELLVIKEVGFALAVAVAIDATIVRLLLVPATMTLLGNVNWWAPKPLRRLYDRLEFSH